MKYKLSKETVETLSTISKGRHRTNLLKTQEQKALAYLVKQIPAWVSSDMLTFLGFFGSLITFSGFMLAAYIDRNFLLLGILGFMVNWFGDSLDGRVAYFRNHPRKWYGFSLDLTVDWLTTILIGTGYTIYVDGNWKFLGVGFVVMYGWEMIAALLRYKITDKYTIDSGWFGPTEVRILISLILIFEVLFKGTIVFSGAVACLMLLVVNIVDTKALLGIADHRDLAEKAEAENLKEGK